MVIRRFPPVESADENGLLAVGGDLEIDSLLLAYKSGIFPWPMHEEYLTWFCPPKRALLWLEDFHEPRSLKKFRARTSYRVFFNKNFEAVIRACSETANRKGQQGTWITSGIVAAYLQFHKAGYAHSVECYDGEDLIGGLYGVSIGGMFAGESMFYRAPNASKVALIYLIEHLKSQGVAWIDCQVMTPLFKQLGVKELKREKFIRLLQESVAKPRLTF